MKYIPIEVADITYIRCADSKIYHHPVKHRGLHDFHIMLNSFERSLGGLASDDDWRELLLRLKYYRFDLCASPLPISWGALDMVSFLHAYLEMAGLSPGVKRALQDLIDSIVALSQLHENPLLNVIEQLVNPRGNSNTALLIKPLRLISTVESMLAQIPEVNKITVINHFQLSLPIFYDQLFIISSSNLYPDHVLSVPRAKAIHLIRYSWFPDKWSPKPVFEGSIFQKRNAKGAEQIKAIITAPNELTEPDDDIAEEPPLVIGWDHIPGLSPRSPELEHEQQEMVQARLLLLANNTGVLLEAEEQAKALVIDLQEGEEDEDEEESAFSLRRISVPDIQIGMFILLRTSGGGDYIVPVADRILGNQAPLLRERQERWKTELRRAVQTKGLFETCIHLLDYGSDKANEINVRNWMSSRTICPRNYKDFLAIMRLVGLEADAPKYWHFAEEIETAHRKAGFRIRKLLLKTVFNSDLQELHKRGKMSFELPEVDGGSLTAFRVEQISQETRLVPEARIGHPISLEVL